MLVLRFFGESPNPPVDPDMTLDPGSIRSSPVSSSPLALLLKARTVGTGLGVLVADEKNCFRFERKIHLFVGQTTVMTKSSYVRQKGRYLLPEPRKVFVG